MRTHPCGGAVGQGSDNPLSVSLFRRYSSHISDRDKILHSDRGPGPHHPCEIWFGSFGDSGGQISPLSIELHWLTLSSLKHPGTVVCGVKKLKSYLDSWWGGTWQLWRICRLFDSLAGILFFCHIHNINCELEQWKRYIIPGVCLPVSNFTHKLTV